MQLALIVGACAKAKAAGAPDGPPLAVPAPPPRVLLPVEEPPLAENPPTQEEAAPPPPRAAAPRTPPPPRRATTGQQPQTPPEEPKPDAPAAQTPEPVARPLTQTDAAADRRVRDVMTKAAADLKRVDYQRLSVDGKAQYDQSKRFNEQAEQELKNRNYVFATTLADKAAALATELLGGR